MMNNADSNLIIITTTFDKAKLQPLLSVHQSRTWAARLATSDVGLSLYLGGGGNDINVPQRALHHTERQSRY